MPKGEYTLDKAVQLIIKFNAIYNPSWIFCDRGYGDYQIERLHLYGEQHPSSGLKNKVVGLQFKEKLKIIDPVTKETTMEPVKQFMVNQLCLTFERSRMILSPFDETLHKQLIDYNVDHISQTGLPVYTSINEHFVDALGLAHLAFVLKFPKLTQAIKVPEYTSKMSQPRTDVVNLRGKQALRDISTTSNAWQTRQGLPKQIGKGPGERRGDYQQWVKAAPPKRNNFASASWGNRGGTKGGRSMW